MDPQAQSGGAPAQDGGPMMAALIGFLAGLGGERVAASVEANKQRAWQDWQRQQEMQFRAMEHASSDAKFTAQMDLQRQSLDFEKTRYQTARNDKAVEDLGRQAAMFPEMGVFGSPSGLDANTAELMARRDEAQAGRDFQMTMADRAKADTEEATAKRTTALTGAFGSLGLSAPGQEVTPDTADAFVGMARIKADEARASRQENMATKQMLLDSVFKAQELGIKNAAVRAELAQKAVEWGNSAFTVNGVPVQDGARAYAKLQAELIKGENGKGSGGYDVNALKAIIEDASDPASPDFEQAVGRLLQAAEEVPDQPTPRVPADDRAPKKMEFGADMKTPPKAKKGQPLLQKSENAARLEKTIPKLEAATNDRSNIENAIKRASNSAKTRPYIQSIVKEIAKRFDKDEADVDLSEITEFIKLQTKARNRDASGWYTEIERLAGK